MKRKYIILLLVLLLVVGIIVFLILKKDNKLTINDVKNIVTLKGENITWSDFEEYESTEIGSGLYILLYEIDETYSLMIGGVPNEKPMYIRLILVENNDIYIDIRYDELEAFLKNNK